MSAVFTDEAHVLARERMGETSLSLKLLTREHGLVFARAKGVLKPGHRSGSALDLFRMVEVTARPVRGVPLVYLSDVRLIRHFPALGSDERRLHTAAYAAQLLLGALQPMDPCQALFELQSKLLEYLQDHEPSWRLVRRFEQRVLLTLGHEPEPGRRDYSPLLIEHCHLDPRCRARLISVFQSGSEAGLSSARRNVIAG